MTTLPPLDPARFQELFDDFGEDAREVIGEFIAETDRAVAALQAALSAHPVDAARVRQDAHRLKGGCMMVGARELQELATQLDALGKQGADARAVAARGEGIGDVWARTRAALLAPT